MSLFFLYFKSFVFRYQVVVLVAFVVAACVGAVLAPRTHAQPAELVAALAAHVHAALVLFNSGLAAWTGLRIQGDPLGVHAVVA